jgi:hypothetical protein
MSILEKYKKRHKFYRINKLIQKYKNNLNKLLFKEQLQEFELEYLIKNFELNINDWESISTKQKLSEDFIEKYKDKVVWINVSINQILSEEFIEEFKNKVDWYFISLYQELSEEFIEKHSNLVSWNCIFECQILSEEFIEKYEDKVL